MKTVFHSNDIECGGCTSSIEKFLSQVDGVNNVIADARTKMVTIEFDDAVLTVEEISAKLDELGFESKVLA